jgi:hypothetical protein
MATGGIFQLITNDGKQDRMLMATALLSERIKAAKALRSQTHDDDTPTLYDIERTHILFTNAHFKPFAAIGYEYNKVTSSSGNPSLGGSVQFSIPQFGDFFNDMIVHAVLEQPTLSIHDSDNKEIPSSMQNLFRWCAYPGERLLKKVKFEVNGNPLDEYTSDAVNYHREFSVQPNKELAWDRCVGQEGVQSGFLDQPNWEGSNVPAKDVSYRTKMVGCNGLQTPSGIKTDDVELFIPLLFWCNKDPRLSVPSVAIPYGQRFITLELASADDLTGEVPRGYSDDLSDDTIWSSSNIAKGGKFNKNANLKSIKLYINNIFVNPDVHTIFIRRIGFTLIRVHRSQCCESNGGSESVLLQNLKWPIEALFVGMRVKCYASGSCDEKRRHLDKWHKFCTVSSEKRLTQGWCGTKATAVGAADIATLLGNPTSFTFNPNTADGSPAVATLVVSGGGTVNSLHTVLTPGDVLSFTSATGNPISITVDSIDDDGLIATFVGASSNVTNFADIAGIDVASSANLGVDVTVVSSTKSELAYHVEACSPNLSHVTIKAHGIPIYNNFPTGFFNAYIPYNYGGHNIRAPRDIGALLITFCLYPGTYQPSGHINISRAREFYIDFETTSLICTSNGCKGNLVVIASAINFLLISDGSAVLRYST